MNSGNNKPRFTLTRVPEGPPVAPKLFSVRGEVSAPLGRRGFLRLGVGVPAAAVMTVFLADHAAAADGVIRAHRGAINLLLPSIDGGLLVSGSTKDDVKKWLLPDGEPQGRIASAASSGVWALFPDGKFAGCGRGQLILIHSFPEFVRLGLLDTGGFSRPQAITAALDGKSLFITDGTDTIAASVAPSGRLQQIARISDRTSPVTCLAASGSALVAGCRDGSLCSRSIQGLSFRRASRMSSRSSGCPHARGGEPEAQPEDEDAGGLSPRAWG